MFKTLSLTGLILGSLLLSGCGGSDTNPMNDKKYIIILKNVPSGICESTEYRNILSEKLAGVLTEEKPNSIQCSDYNKKNDRVECGVDYYSGSNPGNVACVVGLDGEKLNKQAKIVGASTFGNNIDTMFIQIAE